jgi:hypothetical protein
MSWVYLTRDEAYVSVNHSGKMLWNEATQRLLRYPNKVSIAYDSEAALVGIVAGASFPVVAINDGTYRTELGSANMTTMGLDVQGTYVAVPTALVRVPGELEPPDGMITIPYP